MLKIESLTRRYPHVTALDGLNMEIGHGQLYGFVGPNGAGKTTTIRIISGLLRTDFRKKCGSMVSGQKRRHAS